MSAAAAGPGAYVTADRTGVALPVYAPTGVAMMDALTAGLVAIANGFAALAGAVVSPAALIIALFTGSLIWLAVVELDDLNRRGTKPRIGRH